MSVVCELQELRPRSCFAQLESYHIAATLCRMTSELRGYIHLNCIVIIAL